MTLATRPWAKGDLQDGRRKVRIALQSLGPPSSIVDQQFQPNSAVGKDSTLASY